MANQYGPGGALFVNSNKAPESKQPDYTGRMTLDKELVDYLSTKLSSGQDAELELSGWKKVSGAGNTFLSLSVKKKFEKGANAPSGNRPAPSAPSSNPVSDDKIPF